MAVATPTTTTYTDSREVDDNHRRRSSSPGPREQTKRVSRSRSRSRSRNHCDDVNRNRDRRSPSASRREYGRNRDRRDALPPSKAEYSNNGHRSRRSQSMPRAPPRPSSTMLLDIDVLLRESQESARKLNELMGAGRKETDEKAKDALRRASDAERKRKAALDEAKAAEDVARRARRLADDLKRDQEEKEQRARLEQKKIADAADAIRMHTRAAVDVEVTKETKLPEWKDIRREDDVTPVRRIVAERIIMHLGLLSAMNGWAVASEYTKEQRVRLFLSLSRISDDYIATQLIVCSAETENINRHAARNDSGSGSAGRLASTISTVANLIYQAILYTAGLADMHSAAQNARVSTMSSSLSSSSSSSSAASVDQQKQMALWRSEMRDEIATQLTARMRSMQPDGTMKVLEVKAPAIKAQEDAKRAAAQSTAPAPVASSSSSSSSVSSNVDMQVVIDNHPVSVKSDASVTVVTGTDGGVVVDVPVGRDADRDGDNDDCIVMESEGECDGGSGISRCESSDSAGAINTASRKRLYRRNTPVRRGEKRKGEVEVTAASGVETRQKQQERATAGAPVSSRTRSSC